MALLPPSLLLAWHSANSSGGGKVKDEAAGRLGVDEADMKHLSGPNKDRSCTLLRLPYKRWLYFTIHDYVYGITKYSQPVE